MRVLVCGSRSWNDVELVVNVLQRFKPGTTVIHGDAMGADTICDIVAKELGLLTEKFPISDKDWETFGRGAGPRRNKEMLMKGEPDVVVAFVDLLSKSPGTKNMVSIAESYGKPVVMVTKHCWKIQCDRCGKEYEEPNVSSCDDIFHRCRTCTWESEKRTLACDRCAKSSA